PLDTLLDSAAGSLPPNEAAQRQQNIKHTKEYHQADDDLNQIIKEIRAAKDPEHFLEDIVEAPTILKPAARIDLQHALVYLVATPWGGFALAASGASEKERFFVVDLPHLTTHLLVG